MASKPTFILKLEAQHREHDRDGTRRLRALLKAALRNWGLKCLSVEPVKPDGKEGCTDDGK